MTPKIFRLIDPNMSEKIISEAINVVNMLLLTRSPAVEEHMQSYASHLLQLYPSPYEQVRWRIVQGLTTVMELIPHYIIPNFERIAEIMLQALKEKTQKVSLAASEFWSGLVSVDFKELEEKKVQCLRNVLPVLCPTLLECCEFQEADQTNLMTSKD